MTLKYSRYRLNITVIQTGEKMKFLFQCLFFLWAYSSCSYATTIEVKLITDGLDRPWSLAFLPDGDFLVTEKKGSLRIVNPQGNISPAIQGLPVISVVGQGGLLDVAVHPDFEKNQWIYLSYVAGSAVKGYSTEVVRAELQGDRLHGHQLQRVKKIFVAEPKTKGGRHFGSRLLMTNNRITNNKTTKKAYLFISLGDRGVAAQAQDLTNHHGSLIRLYDDGSIPSDNPFVKVSDAKGEIFSYGHRNIQGLAVHPQTGELWAHEHGPQGGDELNRIEIGKNYGWPVITYGVNYGLGTKIGEGTHKQGMEQPRYFWDPSIAPSGLAFYQQRWLVGALKFQLLAELTPANDSFSEQRYLHNQWGRVRDVRVKGKNIYLLTDSSKGKLLQLRMTP
ncbi:MAG: glucose/arabinose dehydrogenase [Kiritimatiellia bacterium]